jgi:hypothetical protein
MDEIFGYFPPVANPPSKLPLLTLLKQARAFGVGIVLATQNPVDLDYKGLANTGTWFIGRLQTERDKARVLDGLEGAAAGTGMRFDRGQMEQVLAGLGNRIFLLNNVHDDAPEIFETRWAMSYLRGPLTRTQIKTLMGARKAAAPAPAVGAEVSRPAAAASVPPRAAGRPMLPPSIPQVFLPVRGARPSGGALAYLPMVLGAGTVRFADPKAGVDLMQEAAFLTPITAEAVPVSWERATAAKVATGDLESSPQEPAQFPELPAAASKAKSYDGWQRDFGTWLAGSQKLELFKHAGSKQLSRPGETERDFRIRLQEASREGRDELKEQLRRKYAPKIASLQERLRRAQQVVEREKAQVAQQGVQAAISVGATLLGAFLGRKVTSVGTIGRATTAARGAARVLKERQDIGRATETVEVLQQELADLGAEFNAEMAELEGKGAALTERLEIVAIRPKKTHIAVQLCALAWAPHWQDAQGRAFPAWE